MSCRYTAEQSSAQRQGHRRPDADATGRRCSNGAGFSASRCYTRTYRFVAPVAGRTSRGRASLFVVVPAVQALWTVLNCSSPSPAHQVRLNLLPQPAQYFQYVASFGSLNLPDAELLGRRSKELFERFINYKIATVTLLDMSIEAVAPIFERINSKGTPLTIVDLMRAATWSEEFDLVDAIEGIVGELDAKNFGGLDKKAILRSISAAAGGGFSESSIDGLRKHQPAQLEEAVRLTKTAHMRAVDFMSTELHIPSDAQLPYGNQVVVLSEIFRVIPHPTATQLEEIKRWFWRTAIGGYFGGWNTGNMTADQAAVKAFAAGAPNIAASVSAPGLATWTAQPFRSSSAQSKILILLLAFNQPRDLLTGQRIDTANALFHGNNKEFHHFFPRDYLKGDGVAARQANALANIVMLTAASNKKITNRAPSVYLRDVEAALGDRLSEELARNLISQAAYEAAKQDNYEVFLRERAKTLSEVVASLTGWPTAAM